MIDATKEMTGNSEQVLPETATPHTLEKKRMSAEKYASQLSKEDFMNETVYREIYLAEGNFRKEQLKYLCGNRARELGGQQLQRYFEKQLKNYLSMMKEKKKERDPFAGHTPGETNYKDLPENARNLRCDTLWLATDAGISYLGKKEPQPVCRQPLLITGILKSMDTGEETIKLMFKDGEKWTEISCSKDILSTSQKIVSLYKYGVSVTSENAKLVVAFLQNMEDCNKREKRIPVIMTTSRLGWNKERTEFLPFTERAIEFDDRRGLSNVWEVLREKGDRESWYEEFRKMRKIPMVNFLSLAYLSAPIVGMLSLDGFVANLFGESRSGKSVANKIACSLWTGYQDGLLYSADNTENSIDGMLGVLRNIPLMMEDLNNMSEKKQKNLQSVIMKICNGTGKMRMTKEIRLRETNYWNTTGGVTSEFRLTKDFHNAGSMNRVLMMQGPGEADCPFNKNGMNAGEILNFFEENHGFAGREFTQALIDIGKETLNRRLHEIRTQVKKKADELHMAGGQELPVAIMLLADEIAEERLFRDGQRVSVEDAVKNWMTDVNSVNQNQRFYETLKDFLVQNSHRFEDWRLADGSNAEYWGRFYANEGQIAILPEILKKLAGENSVDLGLFLEFLEKRHLLIPDKNGNQQNVVYSRILKKSKRMYRISIEDAEETGQSDAPVKSVGSAEDIDIKEEIPFP